MMQRSKALLSLLLIFLLSNSIVLALGVEPLVINLNLFPGDSEEFKLAISADSWEKNVWLNLYRPVQEIDGSIVYDLLNLFDLPFGNKWVKLESNRISLTPGEQTFITGTVNVPFDARGYHTEVVMVEPEVAEAKQGITFKVRYAVFVNINVAGVGLREEAKISELELNRGDADESVLEFRLSNTSQLRYVASAEATIRDEKNRLVERVELRTPSAWQSNLESTRIMPAAEVLFTGKLSQPLFPGKYNIRLFVRYGESQLVQNKVVEITDADFSSSTAKIEYLKISPDSLDARLIPGGSTSKVIQISNNSPEELEIKVGPHDIERDYANSVFTQAGVTMRTNPEFTLVPRGQERMILTLNAPRDLAPGGYYGYLDISVFSKGELLEKHLVDLSLTTQGDVSYSAEAISLAHNTLDGEQLFSVDLKNLSNSEIVPEATLNLNADDGTLVRTLHLELEEGIARVLPQRVGRIVAVTKGIKPGNYTAEIVIRHNLSKIATAEFPVTIE